MILFGSGQTKRFQWLEKLAAKVPNLGKSLPFPNINYSHREKQENEDQGAFNFEDVAETIADKLVRRHPHVFGDVKADTPDELEAVWKAVKKEEKKTLLKQKHIRQV